MILILNSFYQGWRLIYGLWWVCEHTRVCDVWVSMHQNVITKLFLSIIYNSHKWNEVVIQPIKNWNCQVRRRKSCSFNAERSNLWWDRVKSRRKRKWFNSGTKNMNKLKHKCGIFMYFLIFSLLLSLSNLSFLVQIGPFVFCDERSWGVMFYYFYLLVKSKFVSIFTGSNTTDFRNVHVHFF